MADFKSLLKGKEKQFAKNLTGNELLIVKGCRKILFLGPVDGEVFWGKNIINDNIYEIDWKDIIRIVKSKENKV